MAGVAQAAPVNVAFQGKSLAAVRADLLKASKDVCKQAAEPLSTENEYWDCVSDTYADALHKLKAALAASATSPAAKIASR